MKYNPNSPLATQRARASHNVTLAISNLQVAIDMIGAIPHNILTPVEIGRCNNHYNSLRHDEEELKKLRDSLNHTSHGPHGQHAQNKIITKGKFPGDYNGQKPAIGHTSHAALLAIKQRTQDTQYQEMHKRLGCYTCEYANRPYLGISAACSFCGKLKVDDMTGKCFTRQEGDPHY